MDIAHNFNTIYYNVQHQLLRIQECIRPGIMPNVSIIFPGDPANALFVISYKFDVTCEHVFNSNNVGSR